MTQEEDSMKEVHNKRQIREQAVNYSAPDAIQCRDCVHYKSGISSCPVLPGHVNPMAHCDYYIEKLPTKKAVNYKIIGGIRAVGNQCLDCRFAYDTENCGKLNCVLLHATVSPKGRCDLFKNDEEH